MAGPSKKTNLKRLLEAQQPDVVFFQETLGASELVIPLLESLFSHWIFLGLDARGR